MGALKDIRNQKRIMFHRIGCSYYLRARYYNTGIGRFTQEDVIYYDGLNLYAYCSRNPVLYEDPSGYAANVTESVGEEK